ncbi:MAG: hypothetical protein IPJ54_01420 [Saprospiraceae bacterium]|nr:hypothetical protein [Saprospiraceae bacterium]
MQRRRIWVALTLVLLYGLQVTAQDGKTENANRKWFVGSTLLLLGNLDDTNNPEYIQLNAGYRITPKDVVQFRFKRSIYAWPLGIPFGPDFDAPGLNYPGHARILAPQLGYQRFWWKGVYTSLYVLNAFEKYVDVNKKKIGNGFTLYTDLYLGYQFTFFKDRFFFEPAIGISFWPIRTGLPDTFRAVEKKWNNYFIQPGLDFGFKF